MSGQTDWEETADGYRLGAAVAKQIDDETQFVILTFGEGATVDTAFHCIAAAMRFGKIVIRGDDANRVLGRELQRLGWVRFGPYVGLPFDAFAVVAVQSARLRRRPGKD